MQVYLEDIQEAEAAVISAKNQFLRERGWKEQTARFKKDLLWSKNNISRGDAIIPALLLTTDEALDVEKIYNKENLHRF